MTVANARRLLPSPVQLVRKRPLILQPHKYNASTEDLVGKRFGYVVVLSRAPTVAMSRWRCRCDCGAEFVRDGNSLKQSEKHGHLASCGCRGRRRST